MTRALAENIYINSNNSRKMHGLPLRRKHNKRKRFYTRCEVMEAVEDFLNFCDGNERLVKKCVRTS